ncbi:uncharacterized protein PAN0_012c4471 [Moesziomyces antarcticus]|uniref:Uncharacterized protein n=2 Tax=Pseudozyma antarctica TaxID=84753 RepID=A0A081CHV3_PSEA2|nr:uncharacterized protein PAN0_012c4471 [Moesziomyces antarcticus]GAK66249.1 hypothetical protein PAN0_012c4471 [Moesziomyces antarcticus]SPO48558.1 uncharacterized protein PSANT_06249 [Moesziomyces antarcticus]
MAASENSDPTKPSCFKPLKSSSKRIDGARRAARRRSSYRLHWTSQFADRSAPHAFPPCLTSEGGALRRVGLAKELDAPAQARVLRSFCERSVEWDAPGSVFRVASPGLLRPCMVRSMDGAASQRGIGVSASPSHAILRIRARKPARHANDALGLAGSPMRFRQHRGCRKPPEQVRLGSTVCVKSPHPFSAL